jgi:hypothetical protein
MQNKNLTGMNGHFLSVEMLIKQYGNGWKEAQ